MSRIFLYKYSGQCAGFAIFLMAALFIIASCGGGGDSNVSGDVAGGGVGGTGIYSGVITGFGSVFVNEVEFDTTGALISVDDNNVTESELRIGMKVLIDAASFKALSIVFEPDVEGPVTDINPVEVLGQIITPDGNTVYEGLTNPADLKLGDNVEISGFIDSNGNILATFIKREDQALTEFEVTGVVSNHQSNVKTFKINNLTVDYSSIQNPPLMSNGLFVEVEGSLQGSILVADELEGVTSFANPGEEVEFEGIITHVHSPDDFEINNLRVQSNDGTEYHHGTSANVVENALVEVKGKVNESGIIIAKELDFE